MNLPEIPYHMQRLPRDERGYPIPFIVSIDTQGKPHFTINDEAKRLLCFKHDLCGICGQRLPAGRWFIGGPLSAFDPHGFYVDPPMHAGCARFALRVCPYLCSPHWGRSIAGKSLSDDERERMGIAIVDYTMLPERPPLFVAAMSIGQRLQAGDGMQTYVTPIKPYRNVEFWRHGEQLDVVAGRIEVVRYVYEYARKHGRPAPDEQSFGLPPLRRARDQHAVSRGRIRVVR